MAKIPGTRPPVQELERPKPLTIGPIDSIEPVRWGEQYECFVSFDGPEGETEEALYVRAEDLLNYRRFQAWVLKEIGWLYRSASVEEFGETAWVDIIASAMKKPGVLQSTLEQRDGHRTPYDLKRI